ASPFAAGVVPGGEAAALREPPPDAAPPAGPAVAAPFTVPGEAPGSWLPPEPQPSVGDATPPPPAEQAPPNGTESPADPPESRPSEWGRAVFGPDSPEGD
ncbi:MAG TPA: hypothetical protein VE575_17705, partial [Acidimicrobiales bacterium]|nr:hypothetical protein [Acidimicrobiales bacterium]